MSELKICKRCGEQKKLADFVKAKRNKNGRGAHCLACEVKRVMKAQDSPPPTGKRPKKEKPKEKVCSFCHQPKPLKEFHRSKRGKAGRGAHCKNCSPRDCKEYQRSPEGVDYFLRYWRPEYGYLYSYADEGEEHMCAHCPNAATEWHFFTHEVEDHRKIRPLCERCHDLVHTGKC